MENLQDLQALKELQKQENELQLKKAQLLSNLKKEVGKEEFEETLQDLHIKKTQANKVMKIAQDYNTYSDNASLDQVILLQKLTIKERKEYLQNDIKDKTLEEIENDIADIKANKKTKTDEIYKQAQDIVKEWEIRNNAEFYIEGSGYDDIYTTKNEGIALLYMYIKNIITYTQLKNTCIKNEISFNNLNILDKEIMKNKDDIACKICASLFSYINDGEGYETVPDMLETKDFEWYNLNKYYKECDYEPELYTGKDVVMRVESNENYEYYCIYLNNEAKELIANYRAGKSPSDEENTYYNLKNLAEIENIDFNDLLNTYKKMEKDYLELIEIRNKQRKEEERKANEERRRKEKEYQERKAREDAEWERKFREDYSSFNLNVYNKPAEEDKPIYKKIYKTLATKFHPDLPNGDTRTMQIVNKLKEQWDI